MNIITRTNSHLPASDFIRNERITTDNDGYYYNTREEVLNGPFPTESSAKYDLNLFLDVNFFLSFSSPDIA